MAQRRSATSNGTSADGSGEFTAEERAAMKERGREARATKGGKKGYDEADLLAKIADMADADREIAEAVHAAVKAGAPELACTLWYGMPAYAKDGKVVCSSWPSLRGHHRTQRRALKQFGDVGAGSLSALPTRPEVQGQILHARLQRSGPSR